MELTVKEMVSTIKKELNQASASSKDEVNVMMAMMNDKTYMVDELGADGKVVSTYCPAEVAQDLAANIIKGATKVSNAEAEELAKNHQFTKKEATAMVTISKEFVNTYLDTGRKLKFGNREGKSMELTQKDKKASTCTFPKRVGYAEDGKAIYQLAETNIPAYKEVKVVSRPK